MHFFNKGNFFGAIALIVGSCVGAGIFGLPYVISKAGLAIGLGYIISLGAISIITCLAYGEVVLRTSGSHQFLEYVHIYLGSKYKKIASVSIFLGFYGAMIAYLIGVGQFLFNIFNPVFGGDLWLYRIFYFIFISIATLMGIGLIEKLEKFLVFAMICIVIFLFVYGFQYINFSNLIQVDFNNIFLPYGIVLFSLSCAAAVPNMKNLLIKDKHKLKQAIIYGMLIPILVYVIFSFTIVGISGINTSENAISGLSNYFGNWILIIGFIFGSITMTTSFMSVGLTLKDTFTLDYKINKIISWLMVIIPPFIIVSLNLLSFIEVIGISGALIGGIDGIFIISMYNKAKKINTRKPEYELKIPKIFTYMVVCVFALGIIYECYMIYNKIF